MENTIYKTLISKNMTQAELARKVGVKREYINRIINRKITPTIPLGLRIAKALGLKVEDIFFDDRSFF
ncbi:MAG: helix-turn-helix domain-containing protein [Candidatus Schekmanbacteria bacterium]|nr:helix-turn-helix domain-containing protein [Candidatus Schekmanbacteria bacterium]